MMLVMLFYRIQIFLETRFAGLGSLSIFGPVTLGKLSNQNNYVVFSLNYVQDIQLLFWFVTAKLS